MLVVKAKIKSAVPVYNVAGELADALTDITITDSSIQNIRYIFFKFIYPLSNNC